MNLDLSDLDALVFAAPAVAVDDVDSDSGESALSVVERRAFIPEAFHDPSCCPNVVEIAVEGQGERYVAPIKTYFRYRDEVPVIVPYLEYLPPP